MPSFARENPHDRAESNDRSGGKRWGEKGSKKSEVGILASYFRFNGGPEGPPYVFNGGPEGPLYVCNGGPEGPLYVCNGT